MLAFLRQLLIPITVLALAACNGSPVTVAGNNDVLLDDPLEQVGENSGENLPENPEQPGQPGQPGQPEEPTNSEPGNSEQGNNKPASPPDNLDEPEANSPDEPIEEAPQEPTEEVPQEPTIDPLTLGSFELRLDAKRFELIEANENGITVPINISRIDGHVRPVTVTVMPETVSDSHRLDVKFENSKLDASETYTAWRAELGVSIGPLISHERRFIVTATDGREQFSETISVDVRPISAPDIYLLIGQSNMEGTSELGARDTSPGGPDELNPRIKQLNVKQNDRKLFNESALFTDEGFNSMNPRFITAEDPLHEPRFSFRNDKEGSFIGLGISFAKAALENTTTDIILVPAAWSGRGFCGNDDAPLSWNASESDEPALGGTLLADRALTRLNMTLRDTGGIFRGILWHQGEADSNTNACAERYENNVLELANRIRREAFEDARGQGARGNNAPVPFILGTMARGVDERGDYATFSGVKQRVDNAHRNIPNVLSFSDIATTDDLVPPAYPCGQNSCIHFGATAYRELGQRYYQALSRVIERNP